MIDFAHAGKNEEKVEGGGMKVDDATAAFAAWLRQLPAHLVNSFNSKQPPRHLSSKNI